MNVPDLIPIRHDPQGRTGTIGAWQGGEFFASFTCPVGQAKWYAALHRFDPAGRHLDSRIRATGAEPEAARLLLGEWLDALPGREYRSIAIAPFEVRVDGVLFGLVIEEEDDEDEELEDDERVTAELYPDQLGFRAPWCGCYET
ncbi:hypothetical protein [Kitasatospora brasiliensis]|uniref:hypothetical protein n=1 Tax=Kitasatospora brasiliensis TaxID=3058040 RepID=UPI00293002B3|nr:hypothetical protein [Kitasatospora sp. K002]